jgi:hypothetical protein
LHLALISVMWYITAQRGINGAQRDDRTIYFVSDESPCPKTL